MERIERPVDEPEAQHVAMILVMSGVEELAVVVVAVRSRVGNLCGAEEDLSLRGKTHRLRLVVIGVSNLNKLESCVIKRSSPHSLSRSHCVEVDLQVGIMGGENGIVLREGAVAQEDMDPHVEVVIVDLVQVLQQHEAVNRRRRRARISLRDPRELQIVGQVLRRTDLIVELLEVQVDGRQGQGVLQGPVLLRVRLLALSATDANDAYQGDDQQAQHELRDLLEIH